MYYLAFEMVFIFPVDILKCTSNKLTSGMFIMAAIFKHMCNFFSILPNIEPWAF